MNKKEMIDFISNEISKGTKALEFKKIDENTIDSEFIVHTVIEYNKKIKSFNNSKI